MASSKKALGILFGVKGGSSINQGSGALILQDLKKIVNQVNNNNKLLPKVELRFDVSDAIKSIDKLQKALNSLQKQTKNINIPNGSKGGAKSSVYTQNLAAAKKYFKELKTLQKAAARTKDVDADEKTGKILRIDGKNYQNHSKYFRELEKDYKGLADVINDGGLSISQKAKALNLTIDEYKELSQVIGELQKQSDIAFDKIKIDATAAWQKQASNVSDSIHRVYDIISKDPAVKNLADDILEMTKQGSGNVEELKQKFQEFNLKARQSGADIETWGQKFKKAFANQVRSALASLITVDIGQFLKGIYDNVVALDDAVVNLQIASGKSRTETKALVKEYAALAKQLKATTAEVAASADTWLRQGYSAKEAEALITNSMMLSKLGQIESEEAATALTSAMKGYKVAVEDTVNIVDKLTAVDMEAAASAGGIATAMAETAAGAGLAGVSMDKLIGYLAVVKEVTQDADESVGVFFRTLFSRMGNIKAGKFVDDDGESLNDVESVLGKLGIKLRNSNDDFRDFSDVLDEVGQKWKSFSETEKNAIASAMAGTRQREKLIVLMDNYGTSLKYAATAAESAGTATQKYEAYTEGVTGSIQELKATFEEFSLTALDSDFVSQFFDLATQITNIGTGLFKVIDYIGGLNAALAITAGILALINARKIANRIEQLPNIIESITKSLKNLATEGVSSVQGAVTAVSLLITGLVVAYNAVAAAKDRATQAAFNSASESISKIDEESRSLAELIEEYKELASISENSGGWDPTSADRVREIQEQITNLVGDQAKNLDLVNGKLEDELTVLKGLSKEMLEQAKIQAVVAKSDAWAAVVSESNAWNNRLKSVGFSKSDSISDFTNSGIRLGNFYVPGMSFTIDDNFANDQDFINQYNAVLDYKNKLANTPGFDSGSSKLYSSLNEFLSKYGEFYELYTSADRKVAEIEKLLLNNSGDGGGFGDDDGSEGQSATEIIVTTEEELNELLDRYKELIELRKELLKTYAKELEYQKELEKKQQKTASLQTKLAVARLDTSAAGQARVRELEAQLEEAQADLEDFTLEHAIEEILGGLDDQYAEYEKFIDSQLSALGEKIDEIKKVLLSDGGRENSRPIEEALDGGSSHIVHTSSGGIIVDKGVEGGHTYSAESFSKDFYIRSLKEYIESLPKYKQIKSSLLEDFVFTNLLKKLESLGGSIDDLSAYIRSESMSSPGGKIFAVGDGTITVIPKYHTGGFVGGAPTLANNEEFAKLLEGEFVSTPSQIKNFMTRTLPQLTSFNSSGGYEFHAPLVEIKCESVTSESMPKLKEIVDEAVGEIKRCLDGGMSRTGYKRSVKKLLT